MVRFDPAKGKGSHGERRLDGNRTTIPRGELARGTLRAMLRDLGIDPKEF